jgi:hypothetical protein
VKEVWNPVNGDRTEEVWANMRDGAVAHLVLVEQLLTTQAGEENVSVRAERR